MLLITSCLALFFFCKWRKARDRNMVVKEDINDTYGDYYADPNTVTEIADNNDYYTMLGTMTMRLALPRQETSIQNINIRAAFPFLLVQPFRFQSAARKREC